MLVLRGLRDVRERRLLTQAQLAEAAGVNRATIGRLERGHPARVPTVAKLCRALEATPDELLGDRRPQPPAEGEGKR